MRRPGAVAACCALAALVWLVPLGGAHTTCKVSTANCGPPAQAPVILAEPPYTVGNTNAIMWYGLGTGWYLTSDGQQTNYSNSYDRFGYEVTAVDLASGHSSQLDTVPTTDSGDGTSHLNVVVFGPSQLPDAPSTVDGRRYRYTVRARIKHCQQQSVNSCAAYGPWESGPTSNPATSVQDGTPPTLTLTIANGAQFTNRLDVAVHLDARDPGTYASGVAFVQFSQTDQFSCPPRSLCTSAFAPEATVNLKAGPDGPRSVFVRVWDNASPPAGAGLTRLGTPAGNVSQAASDTILLDTTGPRVQVDRTPEPAKAGKPVSFDASSSVDQAGFGADSGVDAATAVWAFGDGTKASGLAATHVYTKEGSYTATFSLRDKVGNQSTLSIPVTIKPADWSGTGTATQNTAKPVSAPPATVSTPGATTPTANTPDTTPPAISALKAHRTGKRARVTLSLSEPATVVVQIERLRPKPRLVLASFLRAEKTGANTLALPLRLRPHTRYRILIAPRDVAGNPGKTAVLVIRS
jgi:hypothetical protein